MTERSEALEWADREIKAMEAAADTAGADPVWSRVLALSPNSCAQFAAGLRRLVALVPDDPDGEATPVPAPPRQLGAGWAFVGIARKAHYFPAGEHRSLCGRYGMWTDEGRDDDNHDSPDNCVACRRRLVVE